jgi:hypothetical protein
MDNLFKKKQQNTFLVMIFTQLYNNQWSNMRKALTIWQGKSTEMNHKDNQTYSQKRFALLSLVNLKKEDIKHKTYQALSKFK